MSELEIFAAALEITDASQRSDYLDRVAGPDSSLRLRLEVLFRSHKDAGNFLDAPARPELAAVLSAGNDPAPTLGNDQHGDDRVAARSYEQEGATQAEPGDDEMDESVLSFLQPSAKAGALGRLGHYEVLEVLGRGGFGTVVRAFDEKLHRMVAIKIMSPQLAATSPARKRFIREARSSAAIRHENVVSIYAIEEQPIPFLVMECVAGETLQQRLDRTGPLDPLSVVRIGMQIALGLAAAHAMSKIHRDIKPANILLENGADRVKLTDFGLARAADDASLTQSGVIAGTPLYMAPEQAQGLTLDHRADQFSLGSVLYVMCSGRPPFRASTTLAVLKRVAEDTPRPVREIIPETPNWLCDIIGKLHAKRPEDRFQSAQDLADVLARCLSDRQSSDKASPELTINSPESKPALTVASEAAVASPRSQKQRKQRWLAAVAAVLVLLSVIGLGFTEGTGVTRLSGTVLRLFSADGTLIVEVDDPDVSVSIDGEDIVIKGAGAKEIRIKPGQYKLLASKDGKIVRQELVTIAKGGRLVVRISREIARVSLPDSVAAEYVLAIGGAIQINDDAKLITAQADLPMEPFRLTGILLADNQKVSDEGMAVFKDCRSLTLLDLNNTQVSATGLLHFKDCTNLLNLGLNQTKTTDAGLAHFERCGNLMSLDLVSTQISDAGLAHFQHCHHLVHLNLNDNPNVTDKGVAHFKNCKSLSTLSLNGTRVSDTALAHFADCTNLMRLHVEQTRVGDVGLGHLKHCKQLTVLHLSQSKVSDAGMAHFRGRDNITTLHVGGTRVGDFGLACFNECKNLKYLYVANTPTTDVGLFFFKDCKSLSYVDLSHTKVTNSASAQLKNCKTLRDLRLDGTRVTDEGLVQLAGFSELRLLGLNHTGVSETAVKKLEEVLPKCKVVWSASPGATKVVLKTGPERRAAEYVLAMGGSLSVYTRSGGVRNIPAGGELPPGELELTRLNLSQSKTVTDAGLAVFKDCKQLLSIWLAGTNVGDEGLAHFAGSRNLRSLDLSGTKVSNTGLAFFKDCPVLEGLYLADTSVSAAGLVHFKDCKNLSLLDLSGAKVNGADLAHFNDCGKLAYLALQRTQVGNDGLAYFKSSRELIHLELADSQVSAACVAQIAGFSRLLSVNLKKTKVAEAGAKELAAALPRCRIVYEQGVIEPTDNAVPDRRAAEWLLARPGHTQLYTWSLLNFGTATYRLDQLPTKAFELRQLSINGHPMVTDETLSILKGLRRLTHLQIKDCKITDAALAHFQDCKGLTELQLPGTAVTDAGVPQLASFAKLQYLNLKQTAVTDTAAEKLAAALPRCKIEWNGGVLGPR